MKCRHCQAELSLPFVDLGTAPPSNAYLTAAQLGAPEKWYPLRVFACTRCWLVQTEDYAHHAELFSSDYAYFSSYSKAWLEHAQKYVTEVSRRFDLGASSHVVEVASNDGYLLQYVQALGIPCLGIEPTASTAKVARERGIAVREVFLGTEVAERLVAEGLSADLVVANNVLAHVPDINDFVAGVARLLKPQGVATFEFPHLMRLVQDCQFDTIYHEHFSYLSLTAVQRCLERKGLEIFDVEEIDTHGGSLRLYAQRAEGGRPVEASMTRLLAREAGAGVSTPGYYEGFQPRANRVKDDFVAFLIEAKRSGKRVVGYGAAAKGNTLMNYAGVRPDLIEFIVDRNPAKEGKFMPGSRIPIAAEPRLKESRPDYIVLLPWNLKAELVQQLQYARDWGARFVTAVPALEVL